MSQDTNLTPELVRELTALRDEAGSFFATQQSWTQHIRDVLHGKTLLTHEARAKLEQAVMITHQMAFNVHRRIAEAREKLPQGYTDGDGQFWHARLHELHSQSTRDHHQAIEAARTVLAWK